MYFQNMKGIYCIPPYFENICFAIFPFMAGRQNSGAVLTNTQKTPLHYTSNFVQDSDSLLVRLTDTEVNALNCIKLS